MGPIAKAVTRGVRQIGRTDWTFFLPSVLYVVYRPVTGLQIPYGISEQRDYSLMLNRQRWLALVRGQPLPKRIL